ncbi:hypothetical protein WJ542_30690 [Paraburkholderia sp. B3]|uniref:hypothetical protein n=1 Tax=Paraburkholderia sp. B3 TaxID=3134791 RepID=UPI003981B50D
MIRKGPMAYPPVSGTAIQAYTESSRSDAPRALRAAALTVLLATVAATWLALTQPAQQVVNAAALMALMETANQAAGGDNVDAVAMAPDPFDLKASGLRLVGEDTLRLGLLASARRYVYENADGKRVVLLGARAWFSKGEPQWSARRIGAMRLIEWTANGTRWVLAGDVRTRGLMRAADAATLPADGGDRGNGMEEAGKDGTWTSVTN